MDRLVALLADAEGAFVDLRERVIDLREKRLFTSAQPEREGLEVLGGCEVHLVGEVVGVERHLVQQRLLRVRYDLFALLQQYLAEPLEIPLFHPFLRLRRHRTNL